MAVDIVKFLAVFIGGAVLVAVCMASTIMVPTILSQLTRHPVPELTTPLDAAVVQDLCQQLALLEEDPLCQPEAIVYAPDFFPAVRAAFERGVTTDDEVQEKLGSYLYRREPTVTVSDGSTYFVCRYDFKGDRAFPVGLHFEGEGVLLRIFATTGDDP